MQQTKCLQAKMFGGLQIQVGDRYLVEKGGRVNKPIELLVYLLLNRGTQITNEQIMEALWGDDEVENPAGALKNAAYSLRRQLTKAGLVQECIITQERQYAWNPDVPVDLDVDQFNHLYETAMLTPGVSQETVMSSCREALALYAGDFLPALNDRYWLMARSSTLRQRYLSMVLHLSDLLLESDDRSGPEEVMNLCSRALLLEPLSEDVYLRDFTAMRKLDMKAAVLSYYPVSQYVPGRSWPASARIGAGDLPLGRRGRQPAHGGHPPHPEGPGRDHPGRPAHPGRVFLPL